MPVITPRAAPPPRRTSSRVIVRLLPARWWAYRDQRAQTQFAFYPTIDGDAYAMMLEWCVNQWGERRFFQPWHLSTKGLLCTTSARMLLEFKMRWHGTVIDHE